MPDYRKYFDKNYLGAWDLDGKDWTLEIARVVQGELKNDKEKVDRKPIIHFKGAKKALAANVTNCKTIAQLYGNKTEAWTGKLITLFATQTQAFGAVHECIRVRPLQPKGKAQTLETETREPGAA
jgi:hypothetical protein